MEDQRTEARPGARKGHLRLAYSREQATDMTQTIKSGLAGPFRLTFDDIDRAVRTSGPGVYALGTCDTAGRFAIMSVGRSDADIKARLREVIGAGTHFKFDSFASDREAFEKECELFHMIKPPGNFIHPGRPAGSTLRCPHCRIFGQQP